MSNATTTQEFKTYTAKDIADRCQYPIDGDGSVKISRLCGLSDDFPDALSFVANQSYTDEAKASSIPAFIVRPGEEIPGKTNLVHSDPDYAISIVAALFEPSQLTLRSAIHQSAVIDPTAKIGRNAQIGPNAVIGANVVIGDNIRIIANSVIMDRVHIGDDCLIHPQCVIREDCKIGDRVTLQPGVIVGGDGYGYALYQNQHIKTPQLGNVVIESDVEIGANAAIDRGRFTETKIGRGTKIDDLVMVAHNVQVGEHCLLVAQSGVSGSSKLGDRVTLAGQVGLVGHINIADDVTLFGQSMATKDISEPGLWAGSPARPANLWKKAVARMYLGLSKKK